MLELSSVFHQGRPSGMMYRSPSLSGVETHETVTLETEERLAGMSIASTEPTGVRGAPQSSIFLPGVKPMLRLLLVSQESE